MTRTEMELEMTENETGKDLHGWFVVKSLAATVATAAARPWRTAGKHGHLRLGVF